MAGGGGGWAGVGRLSFGRNPSPPRWLEKKPDSKQAGDLVAAEHKEPHQPPNGKPGFGLTTRISFQNKAKFRIGQPEPFPPV